MKKLLVILIAAISVVTGVSEFVVASGQSGCASMNLNVLGMRKQLSSDWKPVDQQDEVGGDVDIRGQDWPISINVGYLYASRKGRVDQILQIGNISMSFTQLEREAVTEEVFGGVKKIWTDENGFSLFVSGGASWIKGAFRFANAGTFDSARVGWYASLGGYCTLANFLNVGIVGRYSDTTLNIIGADLNAGGWHYGVLAGFHF